MSSPQRVVAVLAHPDDEALAVGGMLARHAAAGDDVTVVTATWAPGTVRARELACAVAALGVRRPPVLLGWADARVPESAPAAPRLLDLDLHEAAETLTSLLRATAPTRVLTHDALGNVTGHPDHVRTHEVTLAAVEAAGLTSTEVLLATHPHGAAASLRALLGERRSRHTVPDADAVLTLDVRPWLPAKVAAVLAHRSEVERGGAPGVVAALDPQQRSVALGTEWYSRARPGR
ncbi:PIG-L deacetylase family protein [Nocardioides bruguierae]|uniref:PIG-L family deacetylase n=1 Tax=Nocardioides bruguierae TaxID=2945102 RepID=A0A9X2IGE2_9ACTN|nr:PIG-L deacetylase family protein [Nocardioides bruguierae]MCM0622282.1 PIG-L family deacetylase [Nocardioides bruguierae]